MEWKFAHSYTVFSGQHHLATGSAEEVAAILDELRKAATDEPVLVFDNATGRSLDFDVRGTVEEIGAQLAYQSRRSQAALSEPVRAEGSKPRGRGRPKLGVVAREVTLLPRHWAWLAEQPGGASVALRKLVEKARKESAPQDQMRSANERAYHFMLTMAGDLPGYEEATRALFAGDRSKFDAEVAGWPADLRNHASWLAFGRVRVQV